MRSPEREVIPRILSAEDVRAGDESIYDPGEHGNAQRFGCRLGATAWALADARFHEVYLDVLAGRRRWSDPELARLGAELALDHPRVNDKRPARLAERDVPDAILADIVEDLVPDSLCVSERITAGDGPPGEGALAALAFVGCGADGRRPVDFWSEETGSHPLVRAARVVDLAPPCVYVDGVPLLPISPKLFPEGPAPAPICVARAYKVPEGWAWSGVVTLPAVPDPAVLLRRIDLELWRIRRGERRATFEDALRRRPEVIYRAAAEGAWRTAHDRAYQA